MKFVDEVSFFVASGKGGPGLVSFRRESMIARGGPDGGDGGRGGDVIVVVETRLHSLLDLRFQKKYKAEDGESGGKANCSGKDGPDLELKVPPGTIIRNRKTGEVIVDMAETDRFVLLKGGIGGKGNPFYKTSVNQAPTVAQKGMPGEELEVELELKLLADVGLVGLPNAGKSTLISRISSARPKVADYPFTTLVPNLGVVRFAEELSFVVADIPGLISGAHTGAGLGLQFLRHIQRTRFFAHLVDVTESMGRTPMQAYDDIRGELKAYDENNKDLEGFLPLSTRPELILLTKIDSIPLERLAEIELEFKEKGLEVMSISSVTGEKIDELIKIMGSKVFA